MEAPKSIKKRVINALIWAVVILATAYIMRGSENSEFMFFILLAGFFATSSLVGTPGSARDELNCLKRKLFGA